jgi:parallel beta-helix repeat protein
MLSISISKRAITIFIAIILLVCAITIIDFGKEVKAETRGGYTSHEPILIDGNGGFTAANGVKSGAGSQNNPYIIEGWNINASSENGIEIKSTEKYFVIRNVYVHGSSWSYWNTGIYFFRVQNGMVENCEIKNTGSGISLGMFSWGNNINGNNISNNENGISLTSDSHENIIRNNISQDFCIM